MVINLRGQLIVAFVPLPTSELLDRYSVRINILGKTSLLPLDVQQSVREMEDLTRHNTK